MIGLAAYTLVPRSFTEDDQVHIGNPVIKPEDIFKYEISYSNRLKIGYLSSTFFVTSIKDAFDWDMDDYEFDGNNFTSVQSCDPIGDVDDPQDDVDYTIN